MEIRGHDNVIIVQNPGSETKTIVNHPEPDTEFDLDYLHHLSKCYSGGVTDYTAIPKDLPHKPPPHHAPPKDDKGDGYGKEHHDKPAHPAPAHHPPAHPAHPPAHPAHPPAPHPAPKPQPKPAYQPPASIYYDVTVGHIRVVGHIAGGGWTKHQIQGQIWLMDPIPRPLQSFAGEYATPPGLIARWDVAGLSNAHLRIYLEGNNAMCETSGMALSWAIDAHFRLASI